jgi:putative ABC transport system permease protein
MLLNYLKMSIRAIRSNGIFSLINIVGLGLGITCSLFIYIYIDHELSTDRYNRNIDQIYVVNDYDISETGDREYSPYVPPVFALSAEENIPEIEAVSRYIGGTCFIHHEDDQFEESSAYVDQSFFSIFTFQYVQGNSSEFLNDKYSIVIDRDIASKYFGENEAVGSTIQLKVQGQYTDFTVSGVVEPVPSNSTVKGKLFIPFSIFLDVIPISYQHSWLLSCTETFLMLKENIDPLVVENSILDLLNEAYGETNSSVYHLQSLSTRYLNFDTSRDYPTVIGTTGLIVLFSIGTVILFLACINFTTLSVGRSAERVKETAVRKILGAGTRHIMIQSWMETALISLISLGLGTVLTEISLPYFSQLAERNLTINLNSQTIIALLTIWTVIIFSSGSYPAIVLSRFKPIAVIRGRIGSMGRKQVLTALVIFQFTVASCLAFVTVTMNNQLRFIQNKDLGFNFERVIELPQISNHDNGFQTLDRIQLRLNDVAGVQRIAQNGRSMSDEWMRCNWNDGETLYDGFYHNFVDHNFAEMLELNFIAGRNFLSDQSIDQSNALIVNESFLNQMGWDVGVGKSLPGNFAENYIVGVVSDFHFSSLFNKIEPLILSIDPYIMYTSTPSFNPNDWSVPKRLLVKISGDNIPATLERIHAVWNELAPDIRFEYTFIDEVINQNYHEEVRWHAIVNLASVAAMLISVLGLIGTTTLNAAKRTKEIGIRKILGATTTNLILYMTKKTTLIVVLANLLSLPVALILSTKWLNNFAYKTNFEILPLILTACSALVIASTTVIWFSWRTASANPIKALKND